MAVNEREAERYLLSLELFGMRFGLDRMRRLMTALGRPERSFRSIHVVGTNGKSSTVRMIAAILSHHGLRTGAYLSPHLISFCERIRIDDRDLDPADFAAAVSRAARAAELVDRASGGDDTVTQFEALTAAAYSELARQGVEVAVIEAGLGGRYDATNVIPSEVQVLTSVGLEHTRWLGPTLADIAREKLDVVQPGATLVLGAGLADEVTAVAERVATERDARIIVAGIDPGVEVGALGGFQRRNFALARTAAQAFLGRLDELALAAAATEVRVPGRLQQIALEPLTLVDGAHNADGMRALVESLRPPLVAEHERIVATVSILDDKDAAGMLSTLLAVCDAVVFTSSHNPRALPPATLQSLATQLGGPPSEIVPDPARALARARQLAGPGGVVIAAGSIYLVADLLSPERSRRASTL
ncbi:MAG TPA: folylpolyglutamate synthase/dihydrofolate synthase family protein [Solirubrobacteraceae bacterium]|nr:folylpolyglutamate synthase/dihydrofolate synthase family protein [Solirubrobacteraceae bacterium]